MLFFALAIARLFEILTILFFLFLLLFAFKFLVGCIAFLKAVDFFDSFLQSLGSIQPVGLSVFPELIPDM